MLATVLIQAGGKMQSYARFLSVEKRRLEMNGILSGMDVSLVKTIVLTP